MPDAAHALECRLLGQHCYGVRVIEPGLRDDGVGHAVAGGQLLDETGLANRVLWVPLRLDIHRLYDVMGAGVGEVIFGQIALFDRAVITVAKASCRLGREPRMEIDRRIPHMMVSIDDRAAP